MIDKVTRSEAATKESNNQKFTRLVKECAAYETFMVAVDETNEVIKDNKEVNALKSKLSSLIADIQAQDKFFTEFQFLAVAQAVRAFQMNFPRVSHFPKDYTTANGGKDLAEKIQKYGKQLDTAARIASFVTSLNKDFEEPKVTRSKIRVPYSIFEIRTFVQLIWSGAMDRDEVRERIAKGKKAKK